MKLRLVALSLALWVALDAAEVNLADGISPSEAVTLALERSPQLRALRQARATAESAAGAAKVLPNPELRSGQVDFIDDGGGIRGQTFNLALRWSPPRLGEQRLKGGAAAGKVSEVDAGVSAAEQQVAARVRLLHMDIVLLDQRIKVAEAAVALRERMVEFLREQVSEGLKTAIDENVVDLALADARAVSGAYRAQRRLALAQLAAELGQPPSNDLNLQPEGEPTSAPASPPKTASLVESAKGRRPEVAALAARCAQSEANLRLRKKEQYPWFSFLQLSRDFGGPAHPNTWGVRFGLDLPIFKWGGAAVAAPAAEAEQCKLEVAAAESAAAAEIGLLAERLRASASELEYQRQAVLPLVERAVELSQQAVEAGRADLLQGLAAEARRLSEQQAYLGRLLDHRRLEVELDLALGRAILP